MLDFILLLSYAFWLNNDILVIEKCHVFPITRTFLQVTELIAEDFFFQDILDMRVTSVERRNEKQAYYQNNQ